MHTRPPCSTLPPGNLPYLATDLVKLALDLTQLFKSRATRSHGIGANVMQHRKQLAGEAGVVHEGGGLEAGAQRGAQGLDGAGGFG